MPQINQSRARRPQVLSGPVVRRPYPQVIVPVQLRDEAILDQRTPQFVTSGPRINIAITQRPIPVIVARPNDDAALAETRPAVIPVTRAYGPLPQSKSPVQNVAVPRDDQVVYAQTNPVILLGPISSPPHVPRPYTTVALQPEPPPPPDVVTVLMSGPRRQAGVASGRPIQAINPRLDDGWEDTPPQVLAVPRVRRAARPLPVTRVLQPELIFEDIPPSVTRGVRSRPNPQPVTVGLQYRDDVLTSESVPPFVQVRQAARPFTQPPPRPLGMPQEQPVGTDVPPQMLAVTHERRPARPLQQVQVPFVQNLPVDVPAMWVHTPRGGPKIPPLTPTVVSRYPDEVFCLEFNPARLYRTFGVNAVFPAVTARVISLWATDTTGQTLWATDSTGKTLDATDTTMQSLDARV